MDAGAHEVVYEYIPEPEATATATRRGVAQTPQRPKTPAGALEASHNQNGSIDVRPTSLHDAFTAFADRDVTGSATDIGPSHVRGQRTEYEHFETPEQRLERLQEEVQDLLQIAERESMHSTGEASHHLGGDPTAITAELLVLQQRLGGLACHGVGMPAAGSREGIKDVKGGPHGHGVMAMSLTQQLERLASGGGSSVPPAMEQSGDGRVTYELKYAPSAGVLMDSSKIAALESSIADIEKRLGALDPSCAFSNLQSFVVNLQKRLSLLDTAKIDSISRRVHVVMGDIETMLAKKAELEGAVTTDQDLDQKVSELYEFCHKWSATASSLPVVVSRLHSMQALHQQSASFASRLVALEQQQDQLAKLLETTNLAVMELKTGLKENMTVVSDSFRTLDEKISAALRSQ